MESVYLKDDHHYHIMKIKTTRKMNQKMLCLSGLSMWDTGSLLPQDRVEQVLLRLRIQTMPVTASVLSRAQDACRSSNEQSRHPPCTLCGLTEGIWSLPMGRRIASFDSRSPPVCVCEVPNPRSLTTAC